MTVSNSDSDTSENQKELIDQYRTYVNTTVNVSERRMRNNRFYVVLLSATLGLISILVETGMIEAAGLLLAGLVGLSLCSLWYLSIVSYKQLNSGKYQVIGEMEAELPFAPFSREWRLLDEGDDWRTYITHTRVERKIPGVLAIPYIVVIIFSLYQIA